LEIIQIATRALVPVIGGYVVFSSARLVLVCAVVASPLAAEVGGDINGDSFDDLVIASAYYDQIRGEVNMLDAGQISVLFGSSTGITALNNEPWGQRDLPPYKPHKNNRFGSSVAVGDFDCDGYSDVAVGVPSQNNRGLLIHDTGAFHVLYGSPSGIDPRVPYLWLEGVDGVPGDPLVSNYFGYQLGAGDSNGDGCDDLAVAAEERRIGSYGPGQVTVFLGSEVGLEIDGSVRWTQDSTGVRDEEEDWDQFGATLRFGDFNGDGFDDLAIGVPGEDLRESDPYPALNAGIVQVLYGSASGPTAADDDRWHQGTPGVSDAIEGGDLFGTALAAGDFDNDGFEDLAIGAPDESDEPGNVFAHGAVHVLYGSTEGLTSGRESFWRQGEDGVLDQAGTWDRFGSALEAADVNGDGYADLVVGVPGERFPEILLDAGMVHVLFGGPDGIHSDGNMVFTEDTPGIPDKSESGDELGSTLATGDYNGDGVADLAIGIPHDQIGGLPYCGAVLVIPGSLDGPDAFGATRWGQSSEGIEGTAQAGQMFGEAVR